jgi:integrase/recombinase XerD
VERPQDLVAEVVYSWLDTWVEKEKSASTRMIVATAIRGMLRWAAREGVPVPAGLWERIEPVQVPEREPRALEPGDLQRLLTHLQATHRTLEQLRDRALFLFLLTSGSRITAALSLDVDQVAGRMRIVQKGGSEHTLVASVTARGWMEAYLARRGRDDQPALWIHVGPRGRHRLQAEQANRIWTALARKAGTPRFTSHMLRHTGATELGERGWSDAEIAQHFGWRSTTMVRRYRNLRDSRRREMADQLDDLLPIAAPDPMPATPRSPRVKVLRGKGPRPGSNV